MPVEAYRGEADWTGAGVDLDRLEPFPGDFWPEPDHAGYETLRDAIRERKRVDVPLDVVRRGRKLLLVDGRNRLRAIRELRDEGVHVAWAVNEVELTDRKVFHFIVAKATASRQLSLGERVAIVVENFLPEYERRAAERQRLGLERVQGREHGRASDLAARAARLTRITVDRAKFVKERCDDFPGELGASGQDLWGKVRRGEMKVTRANEIAKRATLEQPDGTYRLADGDRAGAARGSTPRRRAPDPSEPAFPDRLLPALARVQREAGVHTPGDAIARMLKYVAGTRARWLAWLRRR